MNFSLPRDHSLPGAKVPGVELSHPGTFAPWNFRSLVLSKRMEDGAKVRNRERKLKSHFHMIPDRYGQTERQTDRFAISVSRVSMLTRDKNQT